MELITDLGMESDSNWLNCLDMMLQFDENKYEAMYNSLDWQLRI